MARRRFQKLVMIVMIAGLSAVVAELTLRLFPQLMPARWQRRYNEAQGSRDFVVVRDAELGFLHPPSADSDRMGFPNEESWPSRASIVFLGDSLVSGPGVGPDGMFTRIIDKMLFDQPTINLALAGAGLDREERVYSRYGAPLQPRLVVAGLFLASDFDNDEQFRAWMHEGGGADYNNFRLAHLRRVTAQPEYVDPLTLVKRLQFGALLAKSRLYLRATDLLQRLTGGMPDDVYPLPDGTSWVIEAQKVAFATTPTAPDDPRVEALMASITRVRARLQAEGVLLLIMLIPSKEELTDPAIAVGERSMAGRVRQRILNANVPLLDLYPAMRAAATIQSPYFAADIHLNPLGHRIVADEFVAWFNAHRRSLGLGEPRPDTLERPQ